MLAGEGEALTRRAVELALAGDPAAYGCAWNASSGRIENARSNSRCRQSATPPIWRVRWPRLPTRAAQGAVTPREAMQFGHVIEAYVRAVEATEFERRLRALEAADVQPA